MDLMLVGFKKNSVLEVFANSTSTSISLPQKSILDQIGKDLDWADTLFEGCKGKNVNKKLPKL